LQGHVPSDGAWLMQRPVWWAALVVLTALVVAVPFALPRTTPRRATVATAVTSVPSKPAPEPVASTVAPSSPPEVAAWPAAARYVLHVGDSSLGFERGLALEMAARFKKAGVRYEAVTELDGGLHSFATSRKLAELVGWKKPDVVLLTLGMNNLTVAHPEEYEADVKSIVAQVGDRTCWWIGPLSIGRPETGLIAMLGRTTAPCGWTNSYDLEIERQPDHLHPTQPGASHWADAIWIALGVPVRDAAP
jgi:hypothetical protein